MSGTPERKASSLALQEKRGRCDVSRDDFSVLWVKKKKSPCPPFSTSICPCVIGSPVSSLLRGICFEIYRLYKCLSLSIWMFYTQSREESVRWIRAMLFCFFSGMKANCICPAIHSLSPQGCCLCLYVPLILWRRREFIRIVWLKKSASETFMHCELQTTTANFENVIYGWKVLFCAHQCFKILI